MRQENKQSSTNHKQPNSVMYSGNLRLKFEKVDEYIQVDRFCGILKVLTNMKVNSYSWSEKEGLNISISLKDPLPLEEIIQRLPMIEKITKKKKELIVTLNCHSADTIFPVLNNNQEGILII